MISYIFGSLQLFLLLLNDAIITVVLIKLSLAETEKHSFEVDRNSRHPWGGHSHLREETIAYIFLLNMHFQYLSQM